MGNMPPETPRWEVGTLEKLEMPHQLPNYMYTEIPPEFFSMVNEIVRQQFLDVDIATIVNAEPNTTLEVKTDCSLSTELGDLTLYHFAVPQWCVQTAVDLLKEYVRMGVIAPPDAGTQALGTNIAVTSLGHVANDEEMDTTLNRSMFVESYWTPMLTNILYVHESEIILLERS